MMSRGAVAVNAASHVLRRARRGGEGQKKVTGLPRKRLFHEIAVPREEPIDIEALFLRAEAQVTDHEIGEDSNRPAQKCRQLDRQGSLVAQTTNCQVSQIAPQPGDEVDRKTPLRFNQALPERK